VTGNNYVKAFADFKESNLVSTDGLENITTLPPYADIDQTSYGLTLHHEDLDYRINPHYGHAAELTGSTGNRTVRKNPDVNPVVYDSLDLESVRYRVVAILDYYIPLATRHVINAGVQGGYQTRKGSFENELFRLGGLRTLRGFDDESILASAYGIGKLEYRYILELNSYLFTFFNAAWYEKATNTATVTDSPYGFGAGIAFDTRLGIVSVNYALGSEQGRPVEFRNAKIHIGLLNYF
jgi:outer membrane protein assembly factor BamA